jgi:microcystin degradation protein MlrC
VGGIAVVLTAGRTQALGLEMFSHLGIDVMAMKLLVLKSSNHFMAAYGPIAAAVLHVHSDGLLRRDDYRQIAYARIARPIWPLDETPLAGLIL